MGFVNSGSDFTSQTQVVNGASNELLPIFGKERGAHARSAVGAGSLPLDMCVEIEVIIEILPSCGQESAVCWDSTKRYYAVNDFSCFAVSMLPVGRQGRNSICPQLASRSLSG